MHTSYDRSGAAIGPRPHLSGPSADILGRSLLELCAYHSPQGGSFEAPHGVVTNNPNPRSFLGRFPFVTM